MINWKVRIANKTFWTLLIPAVLLVAEKALEIFGVRLDFGEIGNKLVNLVNAVFYVLMILGIVTDPTTAGIKDSVRAMGYEEPWEDIPDGEEEPPDM